MGVWVCACACVGMGVCVIVRACVRVHVLWGVCCMCVYEKALLSLLNLAKPVSLAEKERITLSVRNGGTNR